MKAFITTGTINVLQPIINKHPNNKIIKLQSGSELTLYYEADENTIFQTAQAYSILKCTNSFTQSGFVVMYHMSLLEDKEDVFTKRIQNILSSLPNTNGFISYRLLKRIGEMGYVVCIQWETKTCYDDWISSNTYQESVLKVSSTHENIFKSPYLKKYSVLED